MIKKVLSVVGLLREVDKEDISAIKDFVIVLKANGLSIVDSVKKILSEVDKLKQELQD